MSHNQDSKIMIELVENRMLGHYIEMKWLKDCSRDFKGTLELSLWS